MRENEQKVLDWVNSVKEEYGLPTLPELPPDATRKEALKSVATYCPMAKAFGFPCPIGEVLFLDPHGRVVELETPSFVTDFMREHDRRARGVAPRR